MIIVNAEAVEATAATLSAAEALEILAPAGPALTNEEAAALRQIVAAVATRDDVENAKPAPDVYLEAARRLGVTPERCIAFEDSNVGLTAAHAAGTMAFMVPDILPPLPEVRAKCLRVFEDLHAARLMLEESL